MTDRVVSVGNGGWIRIDDPNLSGPLYVRFVREDDGRLGARDMYLQGDVRAIAPPDLRAIPLSDIEGWANSDPLRWQIDSDLLTPAPDVRTLLSFFSTTFGRRAPEHWVKLSFESQLPDFSGPQPDRPKDGEPPARAERRPLRKPTSEPYGDEFYAEVAAAVRHLLADVRSPAPVLAAEAGVPVSTVHRWVREARRRGHLPPGRTGRSG